MKKLLSALLLIALIINTKVIIHSGHNHYILTGRYINAAVVYSDGDMCAWLGNHCYTRLGEIDAYNYSNL